LLFRIIIFFPFDNNSYQVYRYARNVRLHCCGHASNVVRGHAPMCKSQLFMPDMQIDFHERADPY